MARNPSISLTESLQRELEELIATGRYQNMSEAMRAGARLLIDQERERDAVIKQLEKAALEGLSSSTVDSFDVDAFLAEKRKKWGGA